MTTHRHHNRIRTAAGATLLLVALILSTGCYRRVVGARGLGTSGTRVQEPTPPTLLDRMIGPEPTQSDPAPRMRVN